MSFSTDLVDYLRTKIRLPKDEMKTIVDETMSCIITRLMQNGSVELPGIGRLLVQNTAARIGRNVQTGEPVQIPAGRRVAFKQAPAMKRALNGG
jgi:DNA-binding protein HU-beta